MPDLPIDVNALPGDAFCGDVYLVDMIPGAPALATIRSWRTRGQGPPFFRLAGCVLYRVSDVREWVERCRVDPSVERDRFATPLQASVGGVE